MHNLRFVDGLNSETGSLSYVHELGEIGELSGSISPAELFKGSAIGVFVNYELAFGHLSTLLVLKA